LCHLTTAARLPDIAASAGLLSPLARNETSDRWGANSDIGDGLVCCAFRPHWGVLRHFSTEESAILIFDAASLAALPGARLSPHNTAAREARSYLLDDDEDAMSTLERCRADKGSAELLVPESVPLSSLRFIIFCDATARDAWWPATLRALGREAPPDRKACVDGDLGGFRFPDGLEVIDRVRPVMEGVDRRPSLAIADSPVPADRTISVDDLAEHLWDDEAEESPDLFDELYVRRRDYADFIDWPFDDEEPSYPDD
jgi:hypothetical protein